MSKAGAETRYEGERRLMDDGQGAESRTGGRRWPVPVPIPQWQPAVAPPPPSEKPAHPNERVAPSHQTRKSCTATKTQHSQKSQSS